MLDKQRQRREESMCACTRRLQERQAQDGQRAFRDERAQLAGRVQAELVQHALQNLPRWALTYS